MEVRVNAKIIQTEEEYAAALAQVEKLMDSPSGPRQDDELESWAWLVANYEARHFPIEPPDVVEAWRFRIEQETGVQ